MKQATVQMTDTTLPAMFLADQCISLKQQVMKTENKEISKAGLNPQGLFRAWKAIFVC